MVQFFLNNEDPQSYGEYILNYSLSIESMIAKMDNNTLIIPEYQRNKVWNIKQMNKLLDTIRRNGFISSIILNLNNEGIYEIVDGQNRLTTIYEFVKGTIKYGDISYEELETQIKNTTNKTTNKTVVIIDFDLMPSSAFEEKSTCKTRKKRIKNKLRELYEKNIRKIDRFTRKFKNRFKLTRKKSVKNR